jgi:hypothetical protein
MAIYDMWLDSMWATDPQEIGNSVTATINLGGPAYAVAQVSLTRAAYFDTPGWDQCYVTEYSSNGNPVDLSNNPPEYLIIEDATSFTFRADTLQGAVTALMNVFLFD